MELMALLASEKRRLVVVGDFNSRADGTGTPTYAYVTGSGFTDVWTRANGKAPGPLAVGPRRRRRGLPHRVTC
jgi:hypothetical protein